MENRKFVKILIPVFILGFFVAQNNIVFAYSIETHAFLTEEIIKFYNQNFSNQQISDDLKSYLIDGSRREDDAPRWMNHFYDPVKNRGLTYDPAIDPLINLGTWQKSKDWAQDSNNQNSLTYKVPATIASILTAIQQRALSALTTETNFTWQRAIRFYVNGEKEKAMFMLGHILHLIEDKGVPDHTRNDAHPSGSPYENYTGQFSLNNPDKNLSDRLVGKTSVVLSDLNSYFDELAKYSNNNFYSKDTIGKESGYNLPDPDFSTTEFIDGLYYVVSRDSDGNQYYLANKKSLENLVISSKFDLNINEKIVKDSYWSRLSTKSVQYGAGVINLFFQEVEKAKNDPNFVKEEKSFFAQAFEAVKNFFGDLFSGQSFQEVDEVSLNNNQSETTQESPVAIKQCSFNVSQQPSHSKVIINEVAWMGSASSPQVGGTSSANDEWVELKNISQANIDISGWQLLDKDEQIKITFPSGSKIPSSGFYLLKRNEDAVPNIKADVLYTGNLKNSDEGLKFFDANCNLIDEALANPNWPAGDNTSKKTMERDLTGFGWHTSNIIGGTPKKENSQIIIEKPQTIPGEDEEENEDQNLNQPISTSTIIQEQPLNQNTSQVCVFNTNQTPNHQKIIINEVAWMGTANSASDEWIELKNISSGAVDLTGWQLIDKGEQIKVVFNKNISAGGFYLLERTDDNTLPTVTADFVYSGILSNTDEGLRLFDQNCNLIDEVWANPNWPAGDNTANAKKTMERKSDLNWYTSSIIGGTPKAENSTAYVVYSGGGGGGATNQQTSNPSQPAKILINEIQIEGNTANDEFIELYNPNDVSVDLTGWSIKRKSSSGAEYSLLAASRLEGKSIPANGYFLTANEGGYAGAISPNASWAKSNTIAGNNTILLYNANQNIVDKVGFGTASDFEITPTVNPPTGQSIQRKFQNNTFVDTDSNANDFEIQTCPSPKAPSRDCSAANQAPRAFFIYAPSNPQVGDLITFNAASSTGQIISYQWDFGDNATSSATTATTTHTYSQAGNYSVNLIVFDNQNTSSTATSVIYIEQGGVNHIVISEISTGTTASSSDEFIEFYNPTNQTIDLTGWELRKRTSTGNESNLVDDGKFVGSIPAKGFFLVAHTNYGGSKVADLKYSTTAEIAYSNNSVVLYNGDYRVASIIDLVSYDKIQKDKSLERKAFKNGDCISAQNDGEFLGNSCDTDDDDFFTEGGSASGWEIRNIPNPQNSQSFPEPRNEPTPPENFIIQYSSSTTELIFNWEPSRDYSGATSTITYKIFEITDATSTIIITATSTTFTTPVNEVGPINFSLQAFDKEGLGSESATSTISVPSFLSNLYFYQDPRTASSSPEYLIETYYNQYPFVPDIYYPYGENSTFKLLVFYLNSEPGKQINIEVPWQPDNLENILPLKYRQCAGGYHYGNSLIIPDISDKCGNNGGAYSEALNFGDLEDNHFIIWSSQPAKEGDYLTIAFYATQSMVPCGLGSYCPDFKLVAIDKTKYYFGEPPTHQPPQLTGPIDLDPDQQNSRLNINWPRATDLDTLDSLLTYEIKYNDSDEWQSRGSATSISRLVAPGDDFYFSVRAQDDFENYSDILVAPWSYPPVNFYITQTEYNDWSYSFGSRDGLEYEYFNFQSISPETDFQFNNVVLKIKQNQANDSANLELSVYADNGANSPDFNNQPIGESIISNVYNLDGSQDVAFVFTNPISLSENIKYWLMLGVQDYNTTDTWRAWQRNSWQNAVASGNVYPNGEFAKKNYYGFSTDSNLDWYLKIGMGN